MEKSIILKSEDYRFPSRVERDIASKDFPRLKNFRFPYKSGLNSLLGDKLPAKEAARRENLYWWDMCLQNRFGFLYESYINLVTNYNRKFQDNLNKCSGDEYINKILFDYFTEVFYYYLFSATDIIGQILNLYYSIGKEEYDSFTRTDFLLIIDRYDGGLFSHFIDEIKEAKTIRNSFTHRFSPNQPDYRSKYKIENGKETFSAGGGHFIGSAEIIENAKESLNKMFGLLQGLHLILKI